MPKGSKQTLRASLMQVEKQTKRRPKQLVNPHELPTELEYIWEWWILSFTGDPLTFTELRSWCELSGISMAPWEVEILKTIDRIYWSVRND